MARLSLLAVLVVCLMGQVECDSRSSSRDRDGQNHENEMCKPVLDELLEIKGILKEINDLGIVTATMQLSQTQPEETQSLAGAPTTQSSILGGGTSTFGQTPAASTGLGTTSSAAVAECPVCGMYETCNNITFECELQECGLPAIIDLFDTNVTTTYTEFENAPLEGGVRLVINFTSATETDNYFQINFSDMKIVEAFNIMDNTPDIPNFSGCYFSNFTIETSGNCENFTYALTSVKTQEGCPGVNVFFPKPVIARCVRFYPAEKKEVEAIQLILRMQGCSAQI